MQLKPTADADVLGNIDPAWALAWLGWPEWLISLELSPIEGTVAAEPQLFDRSSYRASSDIVVRGVPVAGALRLSDDVRGLRTKDLIAELDSISSQIRQITSQVEKAVERLRPDPRAT